MLLKQVIVMRKDLNMRKGKMVAQGAHASLMAYLKTQDASGWAVGHNFAASAWLVDCKQTKICVGIDSEEALLDIYNQAQKAGLPCSLVLDAAHTEFEVPTYTSVAIGPGDSERIDLITGALKLL